MKDVNKFIDKSDYNTLKRSYMDACSNIDFYNYVSSLPIEDAQSSNSMTNGFLVLLRYIFKTIIFILSLQNTTRSHTFNSEILSVLSL